MTLRTLDPLLQRTWLRHWHTVIDEVFGRDPKFDFEAACEDPYGDFRMHFMTWGLPDESLQRCFQVLPHGDEICKRAIEMRSRCRASEPNLSERDALEHFRRGIDSFARFVENEDLKKPIRVMRGTSGEIGEQMARADRVAVLFEDVHWNLSSEVANAGAFLGETLYRLANSYDVADYVDWPLLPDPESIDPFRSFATLALSNKYYPLIDADGPVLFVETDEVRN